MPAKRPKKVGSRKSSQQGLEWVGARFPAPMYVMEGGPYRPEMVLLLELPTELIVGMHIAEPEAPASFGNVVRRALVQPLAGPPRTPDRIRVANRRLAEEVRNVAGDSIPVVVAPTPEVDAAAEQFRRAMGDGGEPTYLDDGRLPEEASRRLFEAARALYLCAPWKRVEDAQVVRVDIPALGVEGACISVIGALGENFGFVAFPSQVAFEAFVRATARGLPEEGPVDLGTAHLALNFEAHRQLPRSMLREVATHGWPLASPQAYPVPMRIDRDAVPHPMEARDLDVLAATALVLARLFSEHGQELARGRPAEASAFYGDGVEVRACYPYESAAAGAAALGTAPGAAVDVEAIEGRLAEAMWRFAQERFAKAWRRACRSIKNFDEILPFSIPWVIYRHRIEGRPVADWFFDEYQDRLSESERAWLESRRRSWLGIWEIEAVEPGVSLDLKDLLTGERRRVHEKMGSQNVRPREALLGSVVEHQGTCLMVGVYPYLLPPLATFQVVREACAAAGAEPGDVPIAKLREEKIERLLLDRWERTVRALERRYSQPPQLANTDGDPLLFTTDRFTFAPDERPEVERGVRGLGSDVEEEGRDASATRFAVVRAESKSKASLLPSTLLGQIEVGDGTLKIKTNSVKRADWLRRRVEEKCGRRLQHRARSHADPTSSLARDTGAHAPASEEAAPTPEMLEVLREQKAHFYQAWVDQPVPALGGRTPREVSRDATARGLLDALLKDMESMESQLPAAEQFDFRALRRELALDGMN